MGMNITEKLIKNHLVSGEMVAGKEIAIKIDQTLTQDSTGTMAYLQFEAIGIPRVKTEKSVAYIDHIHLRECGSSIQESAINNKISIHPNPANTFINIDIDENYNGDFHVTIYNSLGVKVLETSNQNNINIESLSSGVYFINVMTEHFSQTIKFSKN